MIAVQKNHLSLMETDRFTFLITFQYLNKVPPKKLTTIDTGSRGPLKGFHFNHETNQFFTTCYTDGNIYGYELIGDLKNDYTANRIFTATGSPYPRSVLFIEQLNKIVVAYESGIIMFYDIGIQGFPVCNFIRLQKNPQ